MKRIMDLVISFILLILTSPIIFIISLCIVLEMGKPIIFKQRRPGQHGAPFDLYKFRTMENAGFDQDGIPVDEQRITALGRFLRKYSLDELPQFMNVLKGEMSLVGPRPLLWEYLPLYTKEQNVRHRVKPGITGWAQVNGRNEVSWEAKFEMDSWYVRNQTVWLDVQILFLTIAKVIKKEGIIQPDHSSMEKFTGSGEGY